LPSATDRGSAAAGRKAPAARFIHDPTHQLVLDPYVIDPAGDGQWFEYDCVAVPPGETVVHHFPKGFLAQWVRLVPDVACRATATFLYR
jgi:hypothetical protein